ncbi:hypothetical protein QBC37DRAFT_393089 [Rhypophila decipiens]|uniref:CorA-like transporter domain-containing protein n=1 Tax=Rhypophila decipiens TaxID=261697 RepID=A0AAN7B216_9PEZI|nr:hypothetical protein QBC37DRAFT_393089 [Rhypophila decipiens]
MATTTITGSPSQNNEPDETIHTTLNKWKVYPSNIEPYFRPQNRPRLIEQIKCYFERIKSNALFTVDEAWGPARTNAIERKIRTVWFDLNERDTPGLDKPQGIKSGATLEAYLGLSGTNPLPRQDPILRFIALESSAPASPRLKITDQLLLKILTYHHVSPYFLDHISHICHESSIGLNEAPFSGFRSLKSFSPFCRVPRSEALGRSGLHYELIFSLNTVTNPEDKAPAESAPAESAPEDKPPSVTTQGGEIIHWPITQCAIYHRFDIATGKSIWIITPPGSASHATSDDSQIPPWNPRRSNTTSKLLSNFGFPFSTQLNPSSSTRARFSASLAIVTWLADWSVSQYDAYIAALYEQIQILTFPFINERGPNVILEITIKVYNQYMETLDQVITALESNMSILESLTSFYCQELINDPDLIALQESSEPIIAMASINAVLAQFKASIASIKSTYSELNLRLNMVKTMGIRRENTTHKLLQFRDTSIMKELQQLTYGFSTITLFLLPISVVSTIFSTDIVKFAFETDNKSTTGAGTGQGGPEDFKGTWSGPAVVWWSVTTFIVTAVVFGGGWWWRRKRVAAAKRREAVIPSMRIIQDSDLLDDEDGDNSGGQWLRKVADKMKKGFDYLKGQGRTRVPKVKHWWKKPGMGGHGPGDREIELDHDPERAAGGR